MERQDFRFEIKAAPDAAGEFEGFASTYESEPDLHGDVIARGAFSKTLQSRSSVPILLGHDPREVIGVGKLSDVKSGLQINGRLTLEDNPPGKRAYSLLKSEALTGLSIGYSVVRFKALDSGARLLQEIKLFEVSLVPFPACESARVTAVKNATSDIAALRDLFFRYRIQHKGII